MKKFILKFLLTGLFIPVLFLVVLSLIQLLRPYPIGLIIKIQDVMIVLWPASILLMAESNLWAVVSILMNIILYGILGILIWLGIYRKKRLFLIPLASLIVLIIYWLKITR